MKQFLIKIFQFITKNLNKKTLISGFLVLSILFFIGSKTAFAAESVTSIQRTIAEFISLIVHLVVYLTWLIIGMMGDLLTNELVMHPFIQPILKLMWTIIRNLVNISFVGLFLYVSFKVIFYDSFKGESNTFTENLPMMIIALVAVNGSYLATTVLIDTSTVAIHAAFAMSSYVGETIDPSMLCKDTNNPNENCAKNIHSIQITTFNVDEETENTKNKKQAEETKMAYEKCLADNKATGATKKDCIDPTKVEKNPFKNLVFTAPYNKDALSWGEESLTENSPLLDKFRELNHIKKQKDYQCGTLNAKKNCNLFQYLKERREAATIVIVVSDFRDFSDLSNRTIVPLIAKNITPLEKFMVHDEGTSTVGMLILESLFSIIMALILLVAFIVLFVILLVRVCVLWIAFMASPLIVFLFFDLIPGIQEPIKSGVDKVIKFAFIPAIFGFVLSFAFIIIGQLSFQTVTNMGGGVIISQGLMDATSPMFKILLIILTIVLVWIGLFWSMKGAADFTDTFIDKVKTGGEGFAGFLGKMVVSSIDIIPIATTSDGKVHKGDLLSVLNNVQRNWQSKAANMGNDFERMENVGGAKYKDSDIGKIFMDINLNDTKKLQIEAPEALERIKKLQAIQNFDTSKEEHTELLKTVTQDIADANGHGRDFEDLERSMTDVYDHAFNKNMEFKEQIILIEKFKGIKSINIPKVEINKSITEATKNIDKIKEREFNDNQINKIKGLFLKEMSTNELKKINDQNGKMQQLLELVFKDAPAPTNEATALTQIEKWLSNSTNKTKLKDFLKKLK